jgi:hypothetical protein
MQLTVLWDIDHTLIENSGVSKETYAAAYSALTKAAPGRPARTEGRTDQLIMRDMFASDGLPEPEWAVVMPVQQRQHLIEHYTSPEKLRPHFIGDWDVLLTLRTNEFTERAHVGQLHDHTHRMGLLLAAHTPHSSHHQEKKN